MRVVADTNVLISAIIFGGLPELFLNLVYANAYTLATSPALLNELDDKLRTKFHTEPKEADRIRLQLEETAPTRGDGSGRRSRLHSHRRS